MLKALLVSLRPPQWPKNVFVLAPLLFSQQLDDGAAARRAALALLAFIAAAGAIYLFNDIRDRDQDRLHPRNRLRPLAAGTLGVPVALTASVLLALSALAIAWILSPRVLQIVAVYLLANVLYTLVLKTIVILDVMIVGFGFVLRVAGGAAAIDVEVSAWLLLCTIFVALLLAFSKRRHELLLLTDESTSAQRAVLAHYTPALLDQMISVLTAATLLSYSLYAIAPETVEKFNTRQLILTLPFVLYGVFRYLYLVYSVEDERNPTEAILHDGPFLANFALWSAATVAVVYLS